MMVVESFTLIITSIHPWFSANYAIVVNTRRRPSSEQIDKPFRSYSDTAIALKKLLAWSVRFIIMGIRGGRLDDGYAKLANKIYIKEISDISDLKKEQEKIVIGDAEFKAQFETATVSVAKLARYYLHSPENTARAEPNPEFIPNDNTAINLEHIMPQSLGGYQPHISSQDIETHLNRLSNSVLMQADKNSKIENFGFDSKKKTYANSSFQLTNQLAYHPGEWNIRSIDDRQKVRAELAVTKWQL